MEGLDQVREAFHKPLHVLGIADRKDYINAKLIDEAFRFVPVIDDDYGVKPPAPKLERQPCRRAKSVLIPSTDRPTNAERPIANIDTDTFHRRPHQCDHLTLATTLSRNILECRHKMALYSDRVGASDLYMAQFDMQFKRSFIRAFDTETLA